jgi:hypothetical protein
LKSRLLNPFSIHVHFGYINHWFIFKTLHMIINLPRLFCFLCCFIHFSFVFILYYLLTLKSKTNNWLRKKVAIKNLLCKYNRFIHG